MAGDLSMQRCEAFKVGDVVTSDQICGKHMIVESQYHQWVTVRDIYGHANRTYMIDCVNRDVYKVSVGDF